MHGLRLPCQEKRVQSGQKFNRPTKDSFRKVGLEDLALCLISLRITDAHAHLNEFTLTGFSAGLRHVDGLSVITNSVDVDSSLRNIEISRSCNMVIPFVGIHPEIFARPENSNMSSEQLDSLTEHIADLIKDAKGIGEIGLDPKYGQMENQEYVLDRILLLAESSVIPITFHCRETTLEILDVLSSYNLRQNIMFHWFAGSEMELGKIHDRGMFTSFGPSILFSKRMAGLVGSSNRGLVLVETDSPTTFQSIINGPSSPFLVYSVAFKMAFILKITFNDMCDLLEANVGKYLATQD